MAENVFCILAPQLNVNDDTIDFLGWKVENGNHVRKGQLICEVETVKSLVEITAEKEGILHHMAAPNSTARVGECLGIIGDDRDAIEKYLSKDRTGRRAPDTGVKGGVKATVKAQALAGRHGIELERVAEMGVKGTVKESDVARYLSQKRQAVRDDEPCHDADPGSDDVLSGVLDYVVEDGSLSRDKMFMARKLRHSLHNKLPAAIDMEIELDPVKKYIQLRKSEGRFISVLPVIMYALGRTLPEFPDFTRFHFNNRMFRYREINVAFIVKTFNGFLYAPVVHRVDALNIEQIAQKCREITLKANRHQLQPDEMEGACFTVSCIPRNAVTRFEALIDQFQSAILAISGEHNVAAVRNGKMVEVPKISLTMTYDHTIVDGWDSAVFLEHLNKEIYHAVSGE